MWGITDPDPPKSRRDELVSKLMSARWAVATARRPDEASVEDGAYVAVDVAKHALGERGSEERDDGAPDLNRHLPSTMPYAERSESLSSGRAHA